MEANFNNNAEYYQSQIELVRKELNEKNKEVDELKSRISELEEEVSDLEELNWFSNRKELKRDKEYLECEVEELKKKYIFKNHNMNHDFMLEKLKHLIDVKGVSPTELELYLDNYGKYKNLEMNYLDLVVEYDNTIKVIDETLETFIESDYTKKKIKDRLKILR